MEHVTINNTDLNVSRLCLGTADLGTKNTEDQAHELLDRFVELGGNFLDTARVYSNWVPGEKSRSERIVGDWLFERGNRDEIVIATKGAHPRLDTMHIPRMSRKEVTADLEASLKSLRIDCIDLYYLHRDDPATPVGRIIDMVNDFIDQGKVRYVACSNWTPARIREAYEYANDTGLKCFVGNQMMWNIGVYAIEPPEGMSIVKFKPDMFELHKELGLTAIPFSSQANGFFSKMAGNNEEELRKAQNSRYHVDRNLELLEVMERLADENDMTVGDIVLAYLVSQPIQTIPIAGCRTTTQLEASVSGVGKRLPEDDLALLNRISGSGLGG